MEYGEGERRVSLLDLPALTLDCILQNLSPAELCTLSAVCTSLRDRCRSDHLWEKRLKQKWGQVIGDAAYRQWRSCVSSRKQELLDQCNENGLVYSLSTLWPFSWWRSRSAQGRLLRSSLPDDSVMAFFLSLESGRLSFPAQVYNRENGHSGFLLSSYDAQLTYDPLSDTFEARYSPHGGCEENIHWNRLREPPADLSPRDMYVSDCLNDLRPGDHVEIQWRRNREFPFGWWYGVVGHLDGCLGIGDENHCHCFHSDTVILEFNQYEPGSQWRQAAINRRYHREQGNEANGFYGGIRKLVSKQEIERWRNIWPTVALE